MICCVCLLQKPNLMEVFDYKGKELNIADIINKHFWFKPQPKNLLTTQICIKCWHTINDFHEFYEKVEKTHHELHVVQENQTSIKEENKPCSSEIKQENEDEKILANDLMQVEIEIDEQLINIKNPLGDGHNNEINSCSEIDCCTSDEYEPSEKSELELGSDEVNSKSVSYNNANGKKKRKLTSKSKKNVDSTKKQRSSHRLDPKLTEEMIKKHITMVCHLCVFVGETFSDIVEHFKDHHSNVKPYIMCCDKKFTRSYVIAQHAIIHENPNSFSCSECNKSFKTSYGLRIHNISYHAPEEERMHACEYCSQKFGRRNLLELHRQTHIPKEQWTIICTKCTTRTAKFATQYLLNIHTSMYHRREANICHVCAKEIKDKKSFEKHIRSHFEDSGPRLKCPVPTCDSWLKDEDNLKLHIQRYHVDDKTYKCPDCEKVCPNRRSLSSHKHYFHSKEVFRCEQCDKTFKKAITLKEHMTQHTGETLYSCPFCPRTFNSSANMHSHKKKQHPIEWEQLRRKKIGNLPNLQSVLP